MKLTNWITSDQWLFRNDSNSKYYDVMIGVKWEFWRTTALTQFQYFMFMFMHKTQTSRFRQIREKWHRTKMAFEIRNQRVINFGNKILVHWFTYDHIPNNFKVSTGSNNDPNFQAVSFSCTTNNGVKMYFRVTVEHPKPTAGIYFFV